MDFNGGTFFLTAESSFVPYPCASNIWGRGDVGSRCRCVFTYVATRMPTEVPSVQQDVQMYRSARSLHGLRLRGRTPIICPLASSPFSQNEH